MSVTTFENARVGDKVEHLMQGEGTITDIIKDSRYPIVVQFKGGKCSYTYDGKFNVTDNARVLFWPGSVYIAPRLEPERERSYAVTGSVTITLPSFEVTAHAKDEATTAAQRRIDGLIAGLARLWPSETRINNIHIELE